MIVLKRPAAAAALAGLALVAVLLVSMRASEDGSDTHPLPVGPNPPSLIAREAISDPSQTSSERIENWALPVTEGEDEDAQADNDDSAWSKDVRQSTPGGASSGYVDDNVYTVENGKEIHIVVAVDKYSVGGLPSLINSTVENTQVPVHFHVFTDGDARMPEAILRCTGILPKAAFMATKDKPGKHQKSLRRASIDIRTYDTNMIKTVWVPVRPELSRPGNYLRFYMHKLLSSDIDDVIYLDSDTLAVRDLRQFLAATEMDEDQVCAAIPWETPLKWPIVSVPKIAKMMMDRRNQEFNATIKSFNAGVMRVNLRPWRRHNLDAEADYWITEQNKGEGQSLWRILGSQMPMQLVAHGRYLAVSDRNWNMFTEEIERQIVKMGISPEVVAAKIGILHATGKEKPYKPGEWVTAMAQGRWRHAAAIVDLFFRQHMPDIPTLERCLPLANRTLEWDAYVKK